MKVQELIDRLLEEDPEREVIIQKDSEGNEYSPLADIGVARYRPETSWSGEVGLEELDAEALERGFTDEDVFDGEDDVPAVILYPTN